MMRASWFRWGGAAFAVITAMLVAVSDAKGAYVGIADGTLSMADGTLVPDPTQNLAWTAATLAWSVEVDASSGLFRYTYSFYAGAGDPKQLSHMTVQVSDGTSPFTSADVVTGTTTYSGIGYDPTSPDNEDGKPSLANPNQNTDNLYGITFQAGALSFTATIITARVPVWGDIFLKDGSVSEGTGQSMTTTAIAARNSGYYATDPTNPVIVYMGTIPGSQFSINEVVGQPKWGYLATPDSSNFNNQGGGDVVPEPTSLALAGFAGIGMAVGAIRRRRQSKAAAA